LTAVFATASNTPLALSIMAVELFGGAVLPHAIIVCVLGYLLTGHRSIYSAQRLVLSKVGDRFRHTTSLKDVSAPDARLDNQDHAE
jgi:H+/Cl- antiporter ClcA